MGGKKMQQFGKEILEMTLAYRKAKGLELPLNAEKEPAKATLDSKHLSYSLFKAGKSVEEIAAERQLATSTIESHLVHFVGEGELPIDRLVEAGKQKAIMNHLKKHNGSSMTEVKSALGDDYSYSEIRFVLKYLEAKQVKS